MTNYLKHMENNTDQITFTRRVGYLKYNYANYLKNLIKSQRILEIGPGKGELLSLLNQQKFTNIDIIDNDQAILNYCQKKYQLQQSILLKNDNILKNLKNKYDLIILTQVFEHIKKERYIFWLKNLYQVLKPNGYIIITVPNGANPLFGTERYGDLQHQNLFTITSFSQLITFANLKNHSYQILPFSIPSTNPLNFIRIILQKLLHSFFVILMIINGAIYQTLLTPNITLVIKKNKWKKLISLSFCLLS